MREENDKLRLENEDLRLKSKSDKSKKLKAMKRFNKLKHWVDDAIKAGQIGPEGYPSLKDF